MAHIEYKIRLNSEFSSTIAIGRVDRDSLVVASASGVSIDKARIFAKINDALAHHRVREPSMLRDLRAVRPTEIETINSAIVQVVEAQDLPVPIDRTITPLVRLTRGVVEQV
ncbi:hypothetical protein FF100_30040 [Methylobacterium terricola]|uniref:Ketopantoate reductase C-terminal domain-containing protein n=1 Tax=Methylobacterium terricola TaxID=2583531 RepID=A0A5C4L9V8_9HYPH|nr:ketopantoate reductase C-terminal domain-containing protein [Methylobacterium terricola]TNC08157.1 hypothetical protein FF100_30040 [Methylobacterium terricola]